MPGRVANIPQPPCEKRVRGNNAPPAEESVYPPGQHPSELRWCTRCRQNLPVSEFRPNLETLSGLHWWCRPCVSENMRRWRAQNAEYVAAYNGARREGPFRKTCSVCDRE
jgi:hypothetical protein